MEDRGLNIEDGIDSAARVNCTTTAPISRHDLNFQFAILHPLSSIFHVRRFIICTFPALCLLVTACSSFRTEMGRPLQTKPNAFVEGTTPVRTVVHDLGPPNQVSRLPDGFAFLYEYSQIGEFQLGISVDISFLRWIKFVKAWNRLNEESLLLTFDNQGVLRSAGSAKWQEGLGGGGAAQLLFAVISLSDISEILRPADAHDWGMFLLQQPPVTLNSAQSLLTGEHGLQQRIAPDYVGQQTLEMTTPKTEKERKRIKKNYQWQHP